MACVVLGLELVERLCADCAFSSLNTCTRLFERGLFFMGMVKAAHTKYLQNWNDTGQTTNLKMERGLHIVFD